MVLLGDAIPELVVGPVLRAEEISELPPVTVAGMVTVSPDVYVIVAVVNTVEVTGGIVVTGIADAERVDPLTVVS